MNISSCSNCGIVVNLKDVKYIEMYPDETEDDYGEINPGTEWDDDTPCETWKCPICKTFNGVKKDE